MPPRITYAPPRLARHLTLHSTIRQRTLFSSATYRPLSTARLATHLRRLSPLPSTLSAPTRAFTSTTPQRASPQPADAIVETLTDLYGTARDEFEIAAEETEKKTVYAADDRDAAREAFAELKSAFEDAIRVSDPEVGKEVQGRVGQRVRELENALVALEESAMED